MGKAIYIKDMKVAIVCDWLIGGGAERVVVQLHKLYPEAPIYTACASDEWIKRLDGKVITSWMQRGPLPALRKFLPVMRGLWFSRLDLSDFDLVISSSGAEAKFVQVKPPAKHIAYIHAPTHYYWSRYNQYIKAPGFGIFNPIARLGLKVLVSPMRRWDRRAAQRPDCLIANSSFTKNQIKKFYGRESQVIHPPVDAARFKPAAQQERHGFLAAGRQTSYKKIDLAVAACSRLNLPLTVMGDGPEHKKLKKMAGPSVKFLGWLPESKRVKYFQTARALIFPGVDDFGITAVEALAAGTPVVAYRGGGALDYVLPGRTGWFFDKPTSGSLADLLEKIQDKNLNTSNLTAKAAEFAPEIFRQKLQSLVREVVQ